MKRQFFLLFFLVIGLFIESVGYAADSADALNQKLSNLHSLQTHFIQTVSDSEGRIISQSEGNMFLEQPGKFRWEVKRPVKQLVIAVKKTILIYDPDLQQMVVRSLPENNASVPALLLSQGNVSSGLHFIVQKRPGKTDNFLLIPRKKDPLFTSFQLQFKGELIYRLIFSDHLNQTTVVEFLNEKRNQPLDSRLFHFEPPKGTDVIYDKNK